MTKKMTKKEMFAEVIALVEGREVSVSTEEIVAFAQHEIELLSRPSKSGPTKAQIENEALATEVLNALLELGKPVTITEFQKQSTSEVATLSNQKLTSLFKALVENGSVVRTVEKKKAYFSVVKED